MHFILSSITAHKNSCYYFPSDLLFLSWNRIPEGRIKQQQKNYFSETGWTRSEKDYWQQTFPFIGKKKIISYIFRIWDQLVNQLMAEGLKGWTNSFIISLAVVFLAVAVSLDSPLFLLFALVLKQVTFTVKNNCTYKKVKYQKILSWDMIFLALIAKS